MRKKKKRIPMKRTEDWRRLYERSPKMKRVFFSISADLSITEFFFTGTERNSWNSNISNGRGNYAVHQDNEGHQFVSETIGRDLCRYQIDLHQFEKQCCFVSKKKLAYYRVDCASSSSTRSKKKEKTRQAFVFKKHAQIIRITRSSFRTR